MSAARIVFQICFVLVILGSFNWGLVVLDPDNNIVTSLLNNAFFYNTVYALIFIAGLVCAYLWLAYNDSILSE